jgi:hypothetical protein
MTLDYPDGVLRRLQESCGEKLNQACCKYLDHRTAETRVEYLRALKTFADLVLRHQPPPTQ